MVIPWQLAVFMTNRAVTTDPKGEVHMKKNVQNVGSCPNKKTSMEGSYITGFVDGEGCFMISFNKREKLVTGIEVRPSFSIGQNKRNLKILELIRDYFGCGAIRFSKKDQCYKYEVHSIGDIRNKIIPHFKKYPLMTSKKADFQIFADVCDMIAASKHLNHKYLEVIIEKAYQMNESGKRRYTKEQLLRIVRTR